MLMKLSDDWDGFEDNLDKFHSRIGTDQLLPGMPAGKTLRRSG